MVAQLKRLLRELYGYARRHPVKLLLVLMPLITGRALLNVLRFFGIKPPSAVLGGMRGGDRWRDELYASSGERRRGASFEGFGDGVLPSIVKIAQMFV